MSLDEVADGGGAPSPLAELLATCLSTGETLDFSQPSLFKREYTAPIHDDDSGATSE